MSKSLFILEIRRRKTLCSTMPNTIENVIGIFTSVKLARKWISNEGKEFLPKDWKSNMYLIWAIVEIDRKNEWSGVCEGFYDLE